MHDFDPVDEDLYDLARQAVIRRTPELIGRVDDNATEADTGDDQAFFAAVQNEYECMLAIRVKNELFAGGDAAG
jgi:hypothetical protein